MARRQKHTAFELAVGIGGLVVAAVALVLAIWARVPDAPDEAPPPKRCANHCDCHTGNVCSDGFCKPRSCSDSFGSSLIECPSGYACRNWSDRKRGACVRVSARCDH